MVAVRLATAGELEDAASTLATVQMQPAGIAIPPIGESLAAGVDQAAAAETPARRKMIRPVTEGNADVERSDLESLSLDPVEEVETQ